MVFAAAVSNTAVIDLFFKNTGLWKQQSTISITYQPFVLSCYILY